MNPTPPTDGLRALHVPPEPGWWPPAPGWWLLTLCVVAVLVWLARWWWARQKIYRWRKVALSEIELIRSMPAEQPEQIQFQVQRCSKLLRRMALALSPREITASLVDDDWLAYLDRVSGSSEYSDGVGKTLVSSPYQPPGISGDHKRLLALIEKTIRNARMEVSSA